MACDICGKVGVPLNPLRDIYQTKDIHDMCNDCEKVINKQLSVLQSSTAKTQQALLKRFMTVLSGKDDVDNKEGKENTENNKMSLFMSFSLGLVFGIISMGVLIQCIQEVTK